MNRNLLILGAISGGLAVVLGAFGAHGLEKLVDAQSVDSFETGVRYQMYHALLVLIVGSAIETTVKIKKIFFYLILSGTVLFSGSIYLLSTQQATGIDFSSIALLTPFGGLLLILSWICLAYSFIKR